MCQSLTNYFTNVNNIYKRNSAKSGGAVQESYPDIGNCTIGTPIATSSRLHDNYSLTDGESWGAFIEITGDFPPDVHKKLSDFPPAPDNVKI